MWHFTASSLLASGLHLTRGIPGCAKGNNPLLDFSTKLKTSSHLPCYRQACCENRVASTHWEIWQSRNPIQDWAAGSMHCNSGTHFCCHKMATNDVQSALLAAIFGNATALPGCCLFPLLLHQLGRWGKEWAVVELMVMESARSYAFILQLLVPFSFSAM